MRPLTAAGRPKVWGRLLDAFHGREAPLAEEGLWLYRPPSAPAGYQQLKVCRQDDGYDIARLDWQDCAPCRLGVVVKIRVTRAWQRQGYGTRMMLRAVRDCEGYSWTTTPQSEFGRQFFPSLTAATGVEFGAEMYSCEHMHAAESGFPSTEQMEPPPPFTGRVRRSKSTSTIACWARR